MALRHARLRRGLIETACAADAMGLNSGTSGNASVRIEGGLLITPSGIPNGSLKPADIVAMNFDGTVDGRHAPSTEWPFHLGILSARPDIDAVIHSHSDYATALACLRRGIPAFHYMIAAAGGNSIRCAPYATVGSEALSEAAIAALADRRACLLANHGVIALGSDLAAALDLARTVETLARQYCLALDAGEPVILDDAEMAAVLEKFKTYGRKPKS